MPLDLIGVSYTYNKGMPQEHTALKNVSLHVPDNSFTAVIGHTGSGKSTLMQLMNGLLKPDQGKVMLNDLDINTKDITKKIVRQKIGLVFQYPEHQLFEEDVIKDVSFGPKNMGLSDEEANRRAMKALALVELTDDAYLTASPFNLSGGEKRRVALAGVLAMEPQILILDEPTAGLDPNGRDKIMQAIFKLHQTQKISVVLVTHSMEEVAKYAAQVNVLHTGSLLFSGSPIEVFSLTDLIQKAGLKLPPAAEITTLLRKRGREIPLALNIRDAADTIAKAWRTKHAK